TFLSPDFSFVPGFGFNSNVNGFVPGFGFTGASNVNPFFFSANPFFTGFNPFFGGVNNVTPFTGPINASGISPAAASAAPSGRLPVLGLNTAVRTPARPIPTRATPSVNRPGPGNRPTCTTPNTP